jgi:ComF family protein
MFVNSLTQFIDELLFPARCILCQTWGSLLCELCKSRLPLAPSYCPLCSRITARGETCLTCKKKFSLDGALSLYNYDDDRVKKIIAHLKFKGNFSCIENLTHDVADLIIRNQRIFEDSVLVPAPLSKSSAMTRGYNQSLLLARSLKRDLQLPINACLRMRDASVQHKKTQADRWKSLNDRIVCKRLVKDIRHAIVVDDILTTGATLEACARALKNAGVKEVFGLTLARQLLHTTKM